MCLMTLMTLLLFRQNTDQIVFIDFGYHGNVGN